MAETSAGKGSATPGPLLLGGIGVNGTRAANEIAVRADVILCIGTRLTDFTTGSHSLFQNRNVRFVSINVNAADAHKQSAQPIVGDARESLRRLSASLGSKRSVNNDYAEKIASLKSSWISELEVSSTDGPRQPLAAQDVIRTLNGSVEKGDWVVAAAGYQPGDMLKVYEVPEGSFTHIEFGFSCMGHEIPAAMGIRLAGATGEVFALIGDGTYLMNPTELVTAVQEDLKLTVLILDNGGFQSIHHLGDSKAGNVPGNEFRRRGQDGAAPTGRFVHVDYVKNAESMGVTATLVETREQLIEALKNARAATGCQVIVCPTDPERKIPPSGAFWDLGVAETSTDSIVNALTGQHLSDRHLQRYY
jgi:3D-(3,5/4)-trihydroxycyclohexane-1,2-dione acylhydrolase (decyclizing)